MASLELVVHERLGHWARQLRPRLSAWPVRLVETRSSADLEAVVSGRACPVVVIDLARRVRAGLEDLDRANRAAPNALVLVLDPGSHAEVPLLARELGATHVIAGMATPPAVAELLTRWLPLAQRRAEHDGWSDEPGPEPEPWNWLAPYLQPKPARARSPRS